MKAAGKMVAGILALPVVLALTYLFFHQEAKPFAFYKENMHGHDVWRLPIIKPHELITADCFNGCRGWSYQTGGTSPTDFNPDSINFQNGCISFHSESGDGYGFLNIKTNKLTRSLKHQQFADLLRKFGVSPLLFHTTSVYDCWRASGQLPWAAEILATQEYELVKK